MKSRPLVATSRATALLICPRVNYPPSKESVARKPVGPTLRVRDIAHLSDLSTRVIETLYIKREAIELIYLR
jgi:hypothetical protein